MTSFLDVILQRHEAVFELCSWRHFFFIPLIAEMTILSLLVVHVCPTGITPFSSPSAFLAAESPKILLNVMFVEYFLFPQEPVWLPFASYSTTSWCIVWQAVSAGTEMTSHPSITSQPVTPKRNLWQTLECISDRKHCVMQRWYWEKSPWGRKEYGPVRKYEKLMQFTTICT